MKLQVYYFLLFIPLIMMSNAFGETIENDIGSLTIDISSIGISSNSDEELKIYGMINSHQKNTRGNILITLPDQTTEGFLFVPTDVGYFEIFYSINGDSKLGNYKILGTYGSQIIGTLNFSISKKIFSPEEIAESRGAEIIPEPKTEEIISESVGSDMIANSDIFVISSSGGDCNFFGKWDVKSKTCTLTKHVNKFLRITDSDIILDGNGFSISTEYNSNILKENGDPRNRIIDVTANNVQIKNISVRGFPENGVWGTYNTEIHSVGIGTNSKNLTVKNSKVFNHGFGIFSDKNCTLENNLVYDNSIIGIRTYDCQIINNEIFKNKIGFSSNGAGTNVLSKNYFHDNDVGANFQGSEEIFDSTFEKNTKPISGSNEVKVHNNNFIENSVYVGKMNVYENYWDTFDSEVEGCVISSSSNFCQSPFKYRTIFDPKPWHIKDGWLYDIQTPTSIEIKAKNSDGVKTVFTVSAIGPNGSLKVTCNHSSGSVFPIGKTQVICSTPNGVVSSFFVTVHEPDIIPQLSQQNFESSGTNFSAVNILAKIGLGLVGVLSLIVLIKGKKKNKEPINDASDYWKQDNYSNTDEKTYEEPSHDHSEFTLKQCYEILELDENATPDQIKASRNRLALQWHPDKHRSASRKAMAEIETKKIITAYEKLREAKKVF